MSLKRKTIYEIINKEGGYSDDSGDSGGETNFGITKQVALHNEFYAPMESMKKSEAYEIYSTIYWDSLKLDDIALISVLIAEEMADTGINMGVSRAAKFLQRALNAMNNRQAIFSDLIVDGKIGDKTIFAMKSFMAKRKKDGELVLLRVLNALQGSGYIKLVERREKDEKYVYGWFLNRVI